MGKIQCMALYHRILNRPLDVGQARPLELLPYDSGMRDFLHVKPAFSGVQKDDRGRGIKMDSCALHRNAGAGCAMLWVFPRALPGCSGCSLDVQFRIAAIEPNNKERIRTSIPIPILLLARLFAISMLSVNWVCLGHALSLLTRLPALPSEFSCQKSG